MSHSSLSSQIAARLPSAVRSASRRTLTVDETVRSVVLSPGGWRLYDSATPVFYATRTATDSAGTLASGETAPSEAFLSAASAGSPGDGLAWPAAGTVTALEAPTMLDDHRELAVKGGAFAVLYLRAASATTIDLEGPFEATQ